MKKYAVFPIALVTVILSLWGCMLFPPGPHIKIEVAPKAVNIGNTSISIKLHETAGIECNIKEVLLDEYTYTGSAISYSSYAATAVFPESIISPRGYLVGKLTTTVSTKTGYMLLTINATDAYNQIFDVCATVTVSAGP